MSVKSAPTAKVPTPRAHSKRSSRTTSCTEGASPPHQQGSCERSGRRACEHCTPPAKVGRFDPVLQNERRSLGLGIGLAQPRTWPFLHSGRPLPQREPPIEPAHPLPTVRDRFFLSGGVPPSRPLHLGLQHETVTLPRRHHHLQATSIQIVVGSQVHLAHRDVGGHSGSCLSAHLCSRTFKREPPLPQNPCHSTRCTMMAKHITLAATSAGAQGQKKRHVESPAQQEAEKLRIQPNGLGPHCERMRARVLSLRAGHTESWRNFALAWFWLLLTPWGCVCQTCVQQGHQPPIVGSSTLWRVPLSDHSQGICPTGPMCNSSNTNCADQSQTTS